MSIFKAIPSLLIGSVLATACGPENRVPPKDVYFAADRLFSQGCTFRQTQPTSPFDYASVITSSLTMDSTALYSGDVLLRVRDGSSLLIRGDIIMTFGEKAGNARKYMDDADEIRPLAPSMYEKCVSSQIERSNNRKRLSLT
jgi:hypothetical protein